MNHYKLHTGISRTYPVTNKEDFENQTGKDGNYQYSGKDGKKRGLGVCPSCDNPVRILGIFNKIDQIPHARHHNKSTAFATFDESAYYHCPEARPDGDYIRDMASKERELSAYEKKMYYAMRNYYDKVIYILRKDLNLYISNSLAERMLKEFVKNKGYMRPDASLYNLPWVLLDSTYSFSIIKRIVKKDTELNSFLRKRDDVTLVSYNEAYDLIESKPGKYTVLIGHFIHHKRNVVDGILTETIQFRLSDSKDVPIHWIYKETYEINQYRFPNLCEKGKNKYRDQKLLDIAVKVMPDIYSF